MEKLTMKELRAIAKELKLKNYWDKNKAQLIAEIDEVQNPKPKPKTPTKRKLIEFEGKSQTLCAWARELNINPNTLYNRIYYKEMSFEEAINKPIRRKS